MKLKKAALFLSALTSVFMLIASCGPGNSSTDTASGYVHDENLNELGALPICKDTVTLKLLIGQNANVSDYKENSYTKKIEENGNVNLQFEVVPSADISTKLNLMMNSGTDLPDVIISGLTSALCANYGANGMIIPLNQYYENSSYYIKEALEKVKDKNIMNYLTAADGNIYTALSYNEILQNEFTHVLWIYKPWLDELGLETPQTLDEYRNVLQAFKDNDLNHNGSSDEIALLVYSSQNAMNVLMNTFITFEPAADMLSVKDGKLRFAYTTEEWKEGLKYLAKKLFLFISVSYPACCRHGNKALK